MKLIDEKPWQELKMRMDSDRSIDGAYGRAILKYAERWANLMEKQMGLGKALEDIAQEASHAAATEVITGFMYGAAVSLLADHWEHGEALRAWYNTAMGQSNIEGTVNPALMAAKGDDE